MFFEEHINTIQTAAHGVSDTLSAAAEHGGGFLFVELLHKAQNADYVELPLMYKIYLPKWDPITIAGIQFDFSPTKHLIMMLIASIALITIGIWAARQIKKNQIPKGFANLIEVFIVFIRDEVVMPNMGSAGLRYLPFLSSMFFFILTMTLVGLIPYGAPATSNINITAALAFIAFVIIQSSAIRENGILNYFKHLTGGVHWALWPVMIPIEFLGLFTKPFALCMRLFANIFGGKTVMLSVIGLVFIFASVVLIPVPILFAIGIYVLELFVAFLQSYIFIMLTAVFMGLGMHSDNSEEHSH